MALADLLTSMGWFRNKAEARNAIRGGGVAWYEAGTIRVLSLRGELHDPAYPMPPGLWVQVGRGLALWRTPAAAHAAES